MFTIRINWLILDFLRDKRGNSKQKRDDRPLMALAGASAQWIHDHLPNNLNYTIFNFMTSPAYKGQFHLPGLSS